MYVFVCLCHCVTRRTVQCVHRHLYYYYSPLRLSNVYRIIDGNRSVRRPCYQPVGFMLIYTRVYTIFSYTYWLFFDFYSKAIISTVAGSKHQLSGTLVRTQLMTLGDIASILTIIVKDWPGKCWAEPQHVTMSYVWDLPVGGYRLHSPGKHTLATGQIVVGLQVLNSNNYF